mmetsp:Transcript_202/g.684  ORF Transcript_202/g.684 Transcript_202/m.684 type:complete len:230 (+) Transcript_202:40-729(+)
MHSRATSSPFFSFPQIVADVSDEYHGNQARIERWLSANAAPGAAPAQSPSQHSRSPVATSPASLAMAPVRRRSAAPSQSAATPPRAQESHSPTPSPTDQLSSPVPPELSLPASPVPPGAFGYEATTTRVPATRRADATIAAVTAEQVEELVPAYLNAQIPFEELQSLITIVNDALQNQCLGDLVTETDLQAVLGGYGKVKALILILLKLKRVESNRESKELSFRIRSPA